MIKLFISLITLFLFSCRVSQEIGSFEFSQKQKLDAHWELMKVISVDMEEQNIFTLKIIEGGLFNSFPVTDTVLINGTYTRGRYSYVLTDLNNNKVKFIVKRKKNKMTIKGIYYNKRTKSYSNIKIQSEL